jgi:hypothetical protein
MAATDRGAEVAASKPHSKRCGAPLKDGRFCGKWTTEATGWETCYQHSVSEAEWKAAARRGGLAAAAKKREAKSGSPRSGLQPHVSLEEVLQVCTSGLSATFADAGLPTEIDWTTRLLSILVLIGVFPRQHRAKPEEAAALIHRVLSEKQLPASTEDETKKLVQKSYEQAREAWRQERGMVAALRGLYTDERYPKDLVAPWEDAAALNAEFRAYMREQEKRLEGVEVLPLVAL